jgi:F-type H+-transporting ATPase subunit b
MMDRAEEQARQIVDKGRHAAEDVAREIAEKARREADATLERTREQMAFEKGRALEELRRDAVDLVVKASEKLIGSSLNDREHRDIVSRHLEEL